MAGKSVYSELSIDRRETACPLFPFALRYRMKMEYPNKRRERVNNNQPKENEASSK